MLLYLYGKSLYGFTFSWGEKGKVGSESTPFYERDSDPTFPLHPLVSRSAVGEHAVQKILQSLRIVQPAFFLYRHLGEMFHEGAGEEADAVVRLRPLSVEESNPHNAAARRGALEDEAGEVQGFQFADPLLCETVHRLGVVHSGVDRDKARRMEIADQVHGLARSS